MTKDVAFSSHTLKIRAFKEYGTHDREVERTKMSFLKETYGLSQLNLQPKSPSHPVQPRSFFGSERILIRFWMAQ